MTSIADRLGQIRQRMTQAAARAGRSVENIQLLAVSKRQPLDRLRAAVDAGQRVFGENQVQEAIHKSCELPTDLDWHFIGPLQSNKAATAVRLFSTIHSIDRPKIAKRLSQAACQQGRKVRVFVQLNLAEEPTKHGFLVSEMSKLVRPLMEHEGLEIMGLMAIPPFERDLGEARKWFRQLRELRDQAAEWPEWQGFAGQLSMGMSHDFEVAIEEGATHVRVGSSIFGARNS